MCAKCGSTLSPAIYLVYEVYACTCIMQATPNGNSSPEYFAEEDIYWAPASTIPALYEQLAHHKYREIPRNQIRYRTQIVFSKLFHFLVPSLLALNRSGESLGSGQFGVVYRGTWQCEMGQVDVAIKTVKGGVSETDRVKFLQEAAINGQFRHPNIVKLHGVVTVGEPVIRFM